MVMSLRATKGGGGVEIGEVVSMSNTLPSLFTTSSGETYLKAGYIIQNDAVTYPAAFADFSFNYFKQTLKSSRTTSDSQTSNIVAGNGILMRISNVQYSVDISTDFGATWTTKNPSASSIAILDLIYGNGVWIVVHNSTNAICRSTDNGATWSVITTPSTSRSACVIDYDYTNNMFVMMAGSTPASTSYWLYTSVDNGATWVATTAILSVSSIVRSLKYVGNSTFVLVTTTGIFRSVSSTTTKTWTRVDGAGTNYFAPQYIGTTKFAFDGSRIVVMVNYNPASSSSSGATLYMFTSYDLGATFVPIDPLTLTNFTGNAGQSVYALGSCLAMVTDSYGQYTEDGVHMYGLFGISGLSKIIFYDRVPNKYYYASLVPNSNYSAYTQSIYEVAVGVPTIGLPIDPDTHTNSNNFMRIK